MKLIDLFLLVFIRTPLETTYNTLASLEEHPGNHPSHPSFVVVKSTWENNAQNVYRKCSIDWVKAMWIVGVQFPGAHASKCIKCSLK